MKIYQEFTGLNACSFMIKDFISVHAEENFNIIEKAEKIHVLEQYIQEHFNNEISLSELNEILINDSIVKTIIE